MAVGQKIIVSHLISKKNTCFFPKKKLSTHNKHSSYRSDPVNTLAMVSCGDRDADTETGTLSSNGQADMPAPKTVPVKKKPKSCERPNPMQVQWSILRRTPKAKLLQHSSYLGRSASCIQVWSCLQFCLFIIVMCFLSSVGNRGRADEPIQFAFLSKTS